MVARSAQSAEVEIARLARGELAVVHAVTRACFDLPYTLDTLKEYRRRARDGFLVARSGDEVVGFSIVTVPGFPWSLFSRVGEIVLIGVRPDHQRRGLGQKLLTASFGHLRERGMRQVRLHVDVTNAPALGLYKRNGMRVSHVVRRYYRNGQDAYRMVGRL